MNSTDISKNGLIKRVNGHDFLSILHAEKMDPFFISLTADSDVWAFVSSTGALSAGRGSPDKAFFPYSTVDKIHDSYSITGPVTLIRFEDGSRWEPFAAREKLEEYRTRHIAKSVAGNILRFGEECQKTGLAFSYTWQASNRFGLVRRAVLKNHGTEPVSLSILDGLRNIMPAGIDSAFQAQSSCLAEAYRKTELIEQSRLGVYALSAGIIDQPIPLESLTANTVWSCGLPDSTVILSDNAADRFIKDLPQDTRTEQRGTRAGYFLNTNLTLAPGESISWKIVINGPLGGAEIADLHHSLSADPAAAETLLENDLQEGTDYLNRLLCSCDSAQKTGDSILDAHHCANVTFNMMRGGMPAHNYDIPVDDFTEFVRHTNRALAEQYASLLNSLSDPISYSDLQARIAETNDPDLERLLNEYLPFTFSRRHGDPSRPWNKFNIKVRKPDGSPRLAYEGNWRDIFQNWEALAMSFPGFLQHFIAKFVNASTIDGYNPYRISNNGLDWEEPDPHDPWAGIGYWGDHQIVYLTKLLEWQEAFFPGTLNRWMTSEKFVYADVPYCISPLEQILKNPRETITFDSEKSAALRNACSKNGSDAVLRQNSDGTPCHVNLLEKLLVPVLAKLTNFVPGGGIWLNTQRPEWNDANNALVGYGLSMVTVCQLRRHLAFLEPVVRNVENSSLSEPVATLLRSIQDILNVSNDRIDEATQNAEVRADIALKLAEAGSSYRDTIYKEAAFSKTACNAGEIADLFATILKWLDASIHSSRRADGLYESYNMLSYDAQYTRFEVGHLYKMLEGQVAVLGTGLLTDDESADLLQALRNSDLFRNDLKTYLLYPDRKRPGFLEKGIISPEQISSSALLPALLEQNDSRLVTKDQSGTVRFAPALSTVEAVQAVLKSIGESPEFSAMVELESEQIEALYKTVFEHSEFTGRSGTMFGYEGLGCTYWHMISKLLLSAQETCIRHTASAKFPALVDGYYGIREGLGFNKTPHEYGAFPTDPYSHTPGKGGAHQPGMTGQVKEEILSRFGELGVCIQDGEIHFKPSLLRRSELLTEPTSFKFFGLSGTVQQIQLQANELAFTFCQTPVIYQLAEERSIQLSLKNGETVSIDGTCLPKEWSTSIFQRLETIKEIRVSLTADGFLD